MILTSLVGMFLAVPGMVPIDVLIFGNIGIALVAGAGAVVNHLIDYKVDSLMKRTHNRPIPQGRVDPKQAAMFAAAIGIAGMLILLFLVNALSAWLTLASFIGYAFIYTGYLKRATPQNIVIGGLSGAMPPLLGWAAVTGTIDPGGLIASADHFCLDASSFLGFGDTSQRRLRENWYSHASRYPRRAYNEDSHNPLHRDHVLDHTSALFDRHELATLSARRSSLGFGLLGLVASAYVQAKAFYSNGYFSLFHCVSDGVVRRAYDRSLSVVLPLFCSVNYRHESKYQTDRYSMPHLRCVSSTADLYADYPQ